MDRELFRNTVFGDILEALDVWKYPSNFEIQRVGLSETTNRRHLKEEKTQDEAGIVTSECCSIENARCEVLDVSLPVPDPFLVGWNGSTDAENPQNWSFNKKGTQILIIMVLTIITFAGSAVYTPGVSDIQKDFHVGHVAATLPLSVFILGYGIGPLVLSPLSELTRFGRARIYVVTSFLFCIFQIGCASVKNLGGLIVLRFIAGVLASPTISTGGASMGDMISSKNLLYALGAWAGAATAAPPTSPLLGAALMTAVDWRFIFWFLAIMIGVLFVLCFFFLAESSHSTILHRRANRLRRELNDDRFYTIEEKKESEVKLGDFLFEILFRPMIIQFKEPGVLAFNTYCAVTYGTLYLFFESCPIVFIDMYGFSIIEYGCAFLGFFVGCLLGYVYLVLFKLYVVDRAVNENKLVPEIFLKLPLYVSVIFPGSLLFFGWTPRVHWMLPIIAEPFFTSSIFIIFQGVFGYLSLSYPRYVASVFASNAFMRSAFASAFPLFGTAMFNGLATEKYPVGWGCTLVAFAAVALAVVSYIFYRISPRLRARSRYAN